MVTPKIPTLNIVKEFFALLRKEYDINVNKRTTAASLNEQLRKKQDVTKRLADQKRAEYGLIKRWKFQSGMDVRAVELAPSAHYSKTKAGAPYVRIVVPWNDVQRGFVRERITMKPGLLYGTFQRKFGDIRTYSSFRTMHTRIKTGKVKR